MAFNKDIIIDSGHDAASDLSSHQYKIVKLDTNGQVSLVSATTDLPFGILLNKPSAVGRSAEVLRFAEAAKVKAGAALALNDGIASNASGLAVEQTNADFNFGRTLQASSAANEIITVSVDFLIPQRIAPSGVSAVDLGPTGYLTKASPFTGVVEGKSGIISFWYNFDATGSNHSILAMYDNSDVNLQFHCFKNTANQFTFFVRDSGGSTRMNILSPVSSVSGGDGWHHFLCSWDVAQASSNTKMYIDDVSVAVSTPTFTDTNLDYDVGDAIYVGNNAVDSTQYAGCLAELYCYFNQFLDLTVAANRLKFISGGKPADLGANGETPIGSSPPLYLKDDAATYTNNSGNGGDLSVGEAGIVDCASSPSD